MDKYLSYEEQLLHPLWKAKRLEILKRDSYTCRLCPNSADESLLHVHHRYYLNNTMAWEYDDIVLITLCDICHAEEGFKLKLYSEQIIEMLKQFGGMADQLKELKEYLLLIHNIETIVHVLHDYWRKNILVDPLKRPLFTPFIATPENTPGLEF